ncbi:unnamed protein product [Rhizophagus irregularis]|nr:unnamed protein product [Rhizophagus irregularis]
MMEAIYKLAMEEEFGCGLQIKSQQELLFGKNEKYKFKGQTKKVRFESTNTSSTQQSNDFPVDKELYLMRRTN